jgi:putative peptidoglycan lipid II flippase
MVMLGREAIALFLGGGAFGASSVDVVYGVLAIFSLRVISEGTLEIVARLMYAQHDTRTPMFVSLIWLGTTASLSYLLVGRLGVRGLAAASTIAFSVQAAILYRLNERRLGPLGRRELAATALRLTASGAAMAATIHLTRVLLPPSTVVGLGVALPVGLLVYLVANWLLGDLVLRSFGRLLRASAGRAQPTKRN